MDPCVKVEVVESPDVPANDTKLYRRIRLPNGLEVLLVSSSHSDGKNDSSAEGGESVEGVEDNDGPEVLSEDGEDNDADDDDEDDEDGELNAAVSCAVAVGSFCDPPDSLGCAHFLEHLLFLGSEEFPGEATFADLISEGGGEDNAFTDSDETVYTFDIRPRKLGEAMRVFAAFLKAPLLRMDSAAREILAIDNEFQQVTTFLQPSPCL